MNTNIASLASSGTFRFRAFLHTTDTEATPELDNIQVTEASTYSTDDNLYVDTKDASQIAPATIYSWLTTTITNSKPANTDIRVLFSTDGRSNWQTYTGGSWQAPASPTARANATSIADAQTNFSSLGLGSGTLDVRLFLYTSDSSATPSVQNINVTSDTGYETSGNWEGNEWDGTYNNQDWDDVSFDVTLPTGTTAEFVCRAGNVSGDLGSYGSALSSGDASNVTGKWFQWKVTLTGGGDATPQIDYFSVKRVVPFAQVNSP